MCHNDALDRLVQGTSYAAVIDRRAPAQRSGVLASLNMVADTLKLLPSEAETRGRWSAATWAQTCRGWLFLTSTPETRTRQHLPASWVRNNLLNLWKLMASGVTFVNGMTNTTACSPARGTLWTSSFPMINGVKSVGQTLFMDQHPHLPRLAWR